MNPRSLSFTVYMFIGLTCQALYGYGDDNANISGEEIMDTTYQPDEEIVGRPPDSHEAMNNRELKPKLTTSEGGERKKRSYEFLMGLVKRNSSGYEVTKNVPEKAEHEAKASEMLLELMIKIAENPQQWTKVHNLLQKIDEDLAKSKELLEKMNVKVEDRVVQTKTEVPVDTKVNWLSQNETETKNVTEAAVVSSEMKPSKNRYQHFSYHRVTGNPMQFNKNPKAYIAVSVIAPKPVQRNSEDDLTLENELKELKPWTHQQNLKNMAQIRSKWIIQSNDRKQLYAP
ncbi:PREDICTED: uncharacterized protein LOC108564777 [Nicrophorus vespilloides]|uniref:Uncharacterized protein LOC108564777 n=1 Tax=Nicrophorus vespilloides TaxID=110193 RepID=A0ABM1MXT4_NICVS|nr:PREDICTED: uncharacterized protein LOC108564777 [Nicrophorus vespilloides]